MKTIKPKIAYAVVDRENPTINVLYLFQNRDVTLDKSEKMIKVEIREIKKNMLKGTW